jgi:hypothetical protein
MNVQKEYANRKFVKRGIDSYKKEKNIFDAAEAGDLEAVSKPVALTPSAYNCPHLHQPLFFPLGPHP